MKPGAWILPKQQTMDNAITRLKQRYPEACHLYCHTEPAKEWNPRLSLQEQWRDWNPVQTNISQYLARLGLNWHQLAPLYPEQLSGGMWQRLHFVVQLLRQPDFLYLDHAFSGLDLFLIIPLIKELKAFSGAIIIRSYQPHLINQICQGSLYLPEQNREQSFENNNL